jgi:DNA-binding transcriptional ArsR family regulator
MFTFKKKDVAMEKGEEKMSEMGKGDKSGVFADLPPVLYNNASRQMFIKIAQDNGSAPSDLALASGIQPSKVSNLLKTLVDGGLVEKDEEEERKYGAAFAFHSLTPKGFRIADEFKLTGKRDFGSSGFGKY